MGSEAGSKCVIPHSFCFTRVNVLRIRVYRKQLALTRMCRSSALGRLIDDLQDSQGREEGPHRSLRPAESLRASWKTNERRVAFDSAKVHVSIPPVKSRRKGHKVSGRSRRRWAARIASPFARRCVRACVCVSEECAASVPPGAAVTAAVACALGNGSGAGQSRREEEESRSGGLGHHSWYSPRVTGNRWSQVYRVSWLRVSPEGKAQEMKLSLRQGFQIRYNSQTHFLRNLMVLLKLSDSGKNMTREFRGLT